MSLEIGKIVEGKVNGLAKFGAFIELGDGVTGLVHISEVSDKYIEDINQELEVGQNVKVKVLSIEDNGKVGLSIRKANEDHSEKSQHHPKVEKNERSAHRKGQSSKNFKAKSQQKSSGENFDALMSSFLRDSEDRLSDLRRSTEGKRGGRGGRRG